MSKFVLKWRKAVKGCVNKSPKQPLIENDYLQPILTNEEFQFEINPSQEEQPIYNDYDILQRPISSSKNKPVLKDSTNNLTRGFKKVFSVKSMEKTNDFENKENVDQNYNYNKSVKKICKHSIKNETSLHEKKQAKKSKKQETVETHYCEIQDASFLLSEDLPLIDFNKIDSKKDIDSPIKSKLSDSKSNLYNRFDEVNDDEKNYSEMNQNLNLMRELDTFVNPNDAFHWYLNLIFETKTKCVKINSQLDENERSKRLNICTAHLLYARNFYEMRISNSQSLRQALINVHPCLIALACLLDSDAVRIVEAHSCTCDSYIYLFSTRLKFCAWKAKLYIILKRPKRSSIDRLTLIEDLTNCHKMIRETA